MRSTWRVMVLFAVGLVLLGISAAGAFGQSATPSPSLLGGESASPSNAQANVRFKIGFTGDVTTMNPLKIYLGTEWYPMEWTYLLPFGFAQKDLGTVPDFVTDVQTSTDGMTFTYTVRDDVKWSDGQPMTAEDMAYTLNLYKDAHAYTASGYLKDMASVEATDATHVVLRSKQPTSLYAGSYLYTFLLPKHVWDNLDVPPKQFSNVPNVGAGPYTIAEYKPGQYVRMVRNPYWNGAEPAIDEIVYTIYKSEDGLAEGVKSGEVDFAYLSSPNIYNSLKGQPGVGTALGYTPSFSEIGMNGGSSFQPKTSTYTPHGDGHPALTDRNVRRAIRMAIDSQTLSDKIWLGYATPGDTIVPPITIPGAKWTPTGSDELAFNLDAANQLLDQSGYKDCDGDGIREMPGCKQPSLEFRYYVRTSEQPTVDTAPFVQNWLKQIGIKADVTAMSSGRLGDIINAGEYDLFDWGWLPDPDPDSMLSYFTCDQRPPDGVAYGNNDSYYCNPEYDKLYQEQHTELDPQKRLEIIQQMQQLYYEDSGYAVKWYDPLLQAYRSDKWTGFQPQPSPQGDLINGYTYKGMLTIRPVGAAGTGAGTKGISPVVWLALLGGLVLIVGALVLWRRSRVGKEERV